MHGSPPKASILKIIRDRVCWPPSHVREHLLQSPQIPHSQSTKIIQNWFVVYSLYTASGYVQSKGLGFWNCMTWTFLNVTVFLDRSFPVTLFTFMLGIYFFWSSIRPFSSSTCRRAIANGPIIPFTMNYIVDKKSTKISISSYWMLQ